MNSILLIFIFTSLSCTENSKPNAPSLTQYKNDTRLMLSVANKFIAEGDVKKLHEVAIATQKTRAMACVDFNKECDLYEELINLVIRASDDNVISVSEHQEMVDLLRGLHSAIENGILILKKSP